MNLRYVAVIVFKTYSSINQVLPIMWGSLWKQLF